MRLAMKERQAVLAATAARYRKATKKEKRRILDELVELTSYSRSYATFVLRHHGQRVRLTKQTVLVADARQQSKRERQRYYDEQVVALLVKLWRIMDCICGKRLAPVLPQLVERLERFGEISPTAETRAKLLQISAATIDRLLAKERARASLKARSRTRPGTLLKQQVPIRTFAEWDELRPGFVEIDLVAHDGGVAAGEYLYTLCVTDVCTGWTEAEAIKNKAQVWTFEALCKVQQRLPFALLGIDSDNGAEFINAHLINYCQQQQLTFTRSRPYRKNDNCYVEQKNYSVIRRAVGYQRLAGEGAQAHLNELYATLRLYTNYCQPSMKLKEKQRIGSRVQKRYDMAQTPYQRLLACAEALSEEQQQALREEEAQQNPAALQRRISSLEQRLLRQAAAAARAGRAVPTAAAVRESAAASQASSGR